jgi:HEAT repeat protein
MKRFLGMVVLVVASCSSPGNSPMARLPEKVEKEFQRFNDPKEIVIGSRFAKLLQTLSGGEKKLAVARLHGSLKSSSPEVRRRAALALHSLGDDAGVPVMIRDLSTVTSPNDRGNIAVALRIMKDPRAIGVLMKATDDSSPYVRGIALISLGEMKARGAYEIMISHLTDFEIYGGCIPMCPAQLACYGLGLLGNKGAIPHLIKALDHKETQGAACQALGELTGKKFQFNIQKWKDWWKNKS